MIFLINFFRTYDDLEEINFRIELKIIQILETF